MNDYRICEILSNPPRCCAKLPAFISAMEKVVDVDVTASVYSQQKSRKVKRANTFFFDDSKFGGLLTSEPKYDVDSDSDPDYDGENSTYEWGSRRRQTDRHKRKKHRRDDSSPEYIPEHLSRKKPRHGKKAMSDLSNYK
ncbi:hypothetical protein Y032_0055g2576 [Ancylostoma ceylanicum]|uniref:Uncharacterized protein n=1 Tax=Ancylostoma ceylanicum TaxID=53326 RepID=A0A016U5Q5_9BILA|nr:hypothetical protein Y032_0055g2576 [Ancylostoma ceylanicum]